MTTLRLEKRQLRLPFLLLLLVCLPFAVAAQAADEFQAGVHYRVLPEPVATADPKRVEVVEVFWYGCHHCYRFTTRIRQWAAELPDDINFVRMPAIWHPKMALHAQAYYAAEELDVLDQLHPKLFDAIHAKGKKLDTEYEIYQQFVEAGVKEDDFSRGFHSFRVRSRLLRAEQRSRQYLVISTPCMVVNGKYLVTVEGAGSRDKMLDVVEFLLAREAQ
ncbi:thiol:disulfide interchange protein DsbA/DsbL [Porticoccus sp. W117]|uniref:thiol:disulfide interchange protein DsbA/DsbL n=1 Tax=Porticoccus sp. W117 TaxID=3054777 RepID=UPI002597A17E|nr:thiol:disulfide interchange protein DsbA/DsbL [Porticoccus sp. W117]MDM3870514.1 thiol:disulfide interchange protein DsbA/DsbL [Porticoccus sp. W117]